MDVIAATTVTYVCMYLGSMLTPYNAIHVANVVISCVHSSVY